MRPACRARDGVARLGRGEGTEAGIDQRQRIHGGGDPRGKLIGDVEPAWHAVDPGRFRIGIAVRRRRPPQRLAEQALGAQHPADGIVRLHAGQAKHRDQPSRRNFKLAARRHPRLVGRHQRPGDLLEIAVAVHERSGKRGDQRGRRLVGNEMAGQLVGNVPRRRRMPRQIGEHGAALRDTGVRIDLAEHDLIARLMQPLGEGEFTAMIRLARVDPGPAGEHVGKARDILLGIAAVHADGVQLHGLAGEILIEPLVAGDAGDRIRAHRLDIVEIEQHRRVAFDRLHHVDKSSEHVGADRLALVGPDHGGNLVRRDAEMVRPEPHQPLDKSDVRAGRGIEARLGFVEDELLRQRRFRRLRRLRRLLHRRLVLGFIRCGRRRARRGIARLAAIEIAVWSVRLGHFLGAQLELLFGRLLGAKIEYGARRLGARWQVYRQSTGLRTFQIGEHGAARVAGNGVDRTASRAEAKSVERKRRRFFAKSCLAACGHRISPAMEWFASQQ